MATVTTAYLLLHALAEVVPSSPTGGNLQAPLLNVAGGRRWTDGQTSGKIDRAYIRRRSGLGIGASDTYNLLAAGALEDIAGQTIDADELKGIMIRCTSGAINMTRPAANGLTIFTAVSQGIHLVSGQAVAFDLGAVGVDVTTASQFLVTESTGTATADYELWLIVAQ